MRRGSTPTNTFTVEIDLTGATIFVTYSQRKECGKNMRVVVEKTGEDLTVTSTKIITTLTQEETLRFAPDAVFIQIRYVFPDGTADASNIIQTTVEAILKDGVIP